MKEILTAKGICVARLPSCEASNVQEVAASVCDRNMTACDVDGKAVVRGSIFHCRGEAVVGISSWKPDKYLFNGMTHIRAWSIAARIMLPGEWMLFFEDDVMIHPFFENFTVRAFPRMLATMINVSAVAGHGVASFGLCLPQCFPNADLEGFVQAFYGTQAWSGEINYGPCTGACAHAYGFRAEALRELENRRVQLLNHASAPDGGITNTCPAYVSCVHDPWGAHQILRQGCSSFRGGWLDSISGSPSEGAERMQMSLPKGWGGIDICGNLYGTNLEGSISSHRGIFLQDRQRFVSSQEPNNRFAPPARKRPPSKNKAKSTGSKN